MCVLCVWVCAIVKVSGGSRISRRGGRLDIKGREWDGYSTQPKKGRGEEVRYKREGMGWVLLPYYQPKKGREGGGGGGGVWAEPQTLYNVMNHLENSFNQIGTYTYKSI